MHDFFEPRFSLTEAAVLASLRPKTVRNWVDRGQLKFQFEEERNDATWRKLSLVDTFGLAIVGVLTRYCVKVDHASAIAADLIEINFADFKPSRQPIKDLALQILHDKALVLHHQRGNSPHWRIRHNHEDPFPEDMDISDYLIIDLSPHMRKILEIAG